MTPEKKKAKELAKLIASSTDDSSQADFLYIRSRLLQTFEEMFEAVGQFKDLAVQSQNPDFQETYNDSVKILTMTAKSITDLHLANKKIETPVDNDSDSDVVNNTQVNFYGTTAMLQEAIKNIPLLERPPLPEIIIEQPKNAKEEKTGPGPIDGEADGTTTEET